MMIRPSRVRPMVGMLVGVVLLCLTSGPAFAQFSGTGSMGTDRQRFASTLLNDGTVLVTGGQGTQGFLASAEVYDPGNETFRPTVGAMGQARVWHSATLLGPSGKVLIAGGYPGEGVMNSAEIYDPASDTFTPTAGSMLDARMMFTATLLQSGKVLIAGGQTGPCAPS
jgi:large repetitive protein